ncbi:DUF2505 domain-containing protein [Mycolicibacterium sphagni]|uniref:DUF2505 domain-containing protein n=1 Tax=Mycolicibacterium sphagni TaxID=1786 RepID=A0ABX2K1G9_9MYCO|nr:DUF2505 domain-containing protein [Mycolicibacterium sphagni]NTY62703.1 DUF2505 domain-containing protein [Mycolicibacterium sphagni]
MPRSIDVLTESPATVEQINAAFGREDYWLARVAGDDSVTLDSLDIDADGLVTVHITQYLGRQLLPGMIARSMPGDLKLGYRETWRPGDDGHTRGEVNVSVGGLGSSRAQNSLSPTSNGSQLRSAVSVEVKVPLVGGKLEQTIAAGLSESIPSMLHFTTTWIAEHA